jgi:hypothetical protein
MRHVGSLALSVLLIGCVPITEVQLLNRLPVAVVAKACGTAVEVPPGSVVTLSTGQCASEGGTNLLVAGEGQQWRYTDFMHSAAWLFHRQPQFAQRARLVGYMVRAQLEPGGGIYIVKPGSPSPTAELSDALHIAPDSAATEG